MKKPILTRLRDWVGQTAAREALGSNPAPPANVRPAVPPKAPPPTKSPVQRFQIFLPDGTEVTQAYLAQEKEIERLKSKIAYLKRQNRMVWGMAMNLKATWPAIYKNFFTSPRPTKKGNKA